MHTVVGRLKSSWLRLVVVCSILSRLSLNYCTTTMLVLSMSHIESVYVKSNFLDFMNHALLIVYI
jgi:hypothetical protein